MLTFVFLWFHTLIGFLPNANLIKVLRMQFWQIWVVPNHVLELDLNKEIPEKNQKSKFFTIFYTTQQKEPILVYFL